MENKNVSRSTEQLAVEVSASNSSVFCADEISTPPPPMCEIDLDSDSHVCTGASAPADKPGKGISASVRKMVLKTIARIDQTTEQDQEEDFWIGFASAIKRSLQDKTALHVAEFAGLIMDITELVDNPGSKTAIRALLSGISTIGRLAGDAYAKIIDKAKKAILDGATQLIVQTVGLVVSMSSRFESKTETVTRGLQGFIVVCSVIMTACGGKTLAVKDRITGAVKDTATQLDSIGKIGDWIASAFGLSSAEDKKWMDMMLEEEAKISAMEAWSLNQKINNIKKMQELLTSAQVLSASAGRVKSKAVTTCHRAFALVVEKLRQTIVATNTALQINREIRPHPVAVHICGPPSGGKSHFVENVLIPDLARRCEYDADESRIYSVTNSQDFWKPYTKERFMVADEAFAHGPDEMLVKQYNQLATDGNVFLEGASLETKAMVPQHHFLISIANTAAYVPPRQHQHHIGGHQSALNSRLRRYWIHQPRLNPDAPDPRLDQDRTHPVCIHRLDTWRANVVDPPCTDFADNVPPRGCDLIGTRISYEEFVEDQLRHWRVFQERHRAAVARLPAFEAKRDPIVVLVKGKTGKGKTTWVQDELVPNLKRQGVAASSINILDDVLPNDPEQFRNAVNTGKDSDVIVVVANLKHRKLFGINQWPELHSRVLSRLPLKGSHTGKDGVRTTSVVEGAAFTFKVGGFPSMEEGLTEESEIDRIAQLHRQRRGKNGAITLKNSPVPPESCDVTFSSLSSVTPQVNRNPDLPPQLIKELTAILLSSDVKRKQTLIPCLCLLEARLRAFQWSGDLSVAWAKERVYLWRASSQWFIHWTEMPSAKDFEVPLSTRSRDGPCANVLWRTACTVAQGSSEGVGAAIDRVEAAAWREAAKTGWWKALLALAGAGLLIFGAVSAFKWLMEDKKQTPSQGRCPSSKLEDDSHVLARAAELVASDDAAAHVLMTAFESADATLRRKKKLPTGMDVSEFQSKDNDKEGDIIYRRNQKSGLKGQGNVVLQRNTGQYPSFQSGEADKLISSLFDSREKSPRMEARSMIMPNAVEVHGQGRVFGIIISGREGITNAHVLAPGGKLICVQDADGHTWPVEVVNFDRKQDLLRFRVTDPKFQERRNIENTLILEENLNDVGGGVICVPGKKESVIHHASMRRDSFNTVYSEGPFSGNHMIASFASRAYPLVKGQCGSPYLAGNRKWGSRVWCAIHAMRCYTDFEAAGALLSLERWRALGSSSFEMKLPDIRFVEDKLETRENSFVEERAGKLMETVQLEDPFKENDRISYKGTAYGLSKGRSGRKTVYSASPVQVDVDKVPSIVPWNEIPEEVRESFPKDPSGSRNQAMAQLVKNEIKFVPRPAHLSSLQNEYEKWFSRFFDESTVRPLSDHEVINGVKSGPLDQIRNFDMGTSVGVTLQKLFKIQLKKDLFDQGPDGQWHWKDCEAARYALGVIRAREAQASKDVVHVVTGALKDELLPREKVEKQGKIRQFQCVDFIELYLTKKYLGFAVGAITERLFDAHHTAGLDPIRQGMRLAQELAKHPNKITFDFSAFDKTTSQWAQECWLKTMENIISQYYEGADYEIAKNLLRTMLVRLEVMDGHLFRINGGVSSGIYWTNFGNSGINDVLVYGAIKDAVFRARGYIPTVEDINEHVTFFTHGDDFIGSVSDAWADAVNYFTLKEAMAKVHGMKITPGNKDSIEQKFEGPDQISFLKRYFVKFCGYRVVGALEKSSIRQQLNWMKSEDAELRKDVWDSCLLEAALWDKDFYTSCAKQALECALRLKIRWVPFSFDHARQYLMEHLEGVDGGSETIGSQKEKNNKFISATFESFEEKKRTKDTSPKMNKNDITVSREGKQYSLEQWVKEGLGSKFKTGYCSLTYHELMAMSDKDRSEVLDLLGTAEHVRQVNSHKAAVDRVGMQLLRRPFPDHDLSKFQVEEQAGYAARWCAFIEGPLWEEAREHHFKKNAHHPESWRDFATDCPDSVIQEMIVDQIACVHERRGLSIEDAYTDVLSGCESIPVGTFARRYGSGLSRVIAVARAMNPAHKLTGHPCPRCDVITTTKMALSKHLKNSHNVDCCPFCKHTGGHAGHCEVYDKYCCTVCHLAFVSEAKASAHCKNAHSPKKGATWVLRSGGFESGALPGGVGTNEPEVLQDAGGTAPVLQPMNMGVPQMVNAGIGSVMDWRDSLFEDGLVTTIEVNNTTAVGTKLYATGYSSVGSMPPHQANYVLQHWYITGIRDFLVRTVGASNFLGSVLVGWTPFNPTSVDEVRFFGQYKVIALNSSSKMRIQMRWADDQHKMASPDNAVGIGGFMTMWLDTQFANSLVDGTSVVQLSLYHRFLPGSHPCTVPIYDGITGLTVTTATSPINMSLGEVFQRDKVALILDGATYTGTGGGQLVPKEPRLASIIGGSRLYESLMSDGATVFNTTNNKPANGATQHFYFVTEDTGTQESNVITTNHFYLDPQTGIPWWNYEITDQADMEAMLAAESVMFTELGGHETAGFANTKVYWVLGPHNAGYATWGMRNKDSIAGLQDYAGYPQLQDSYEYIVLSAGSDVIGAPGRVVSYTDNSKRLSFQSENFFAPILTVPNDTKYPRTANSTLDTDLINAVISQAAGTGNFVHVTVDLDGTELNLSWDTIGKQWTVNVDLNYGQLTVDATRAKINRISKATNRMPRRSLIQNWTGTGNSFESGALAVWAQNDQQDFSQEQLAELQSFTAEQMDANRHNTTVNNFLRLAANARQQMRLLDWASDKFYYGKTGATIAANTGTSSDITSSQEAVDVNREASSQSSSAETKGTSRNRGIYSTYPPPQETASAPKSADSSWFNPEKFANLAVADSTKKFKPVQFVKEGEAPEPKGSGAMLPPAGAEDALDVIKGAPKSAYPGGPGKPVVMTEADKSVPPKVYTNDEVANAFASAPPQDPEAGRVQLPRSFDTPI